MSVAPWASGTATFLFVFITVICWASLRPSSPWLDVSLFVPGSFKPWVQNGTRLAVETVWTSSQVALQMHVPRDYSKVFEINDLNKAAIVASAIHATPDVVLLLEDIQKSSFVFGVMTRIAVWLTLTAALLLFAKSITRTFGGECANSRVVSATVSRAGITFRRFQMKRPLIEKGRALPYVLAGISGILALCAGVSYAMTLQVDVKTLLPTIVRDLQILCITHGVHSCSIEYEVRVGTMLFVLANALQVVCALSFPLFWDRGCTKTKDWAVAETSLRSRTTSEHEHVAKRVLMDDRSR